MVVARLSSHQQTCMLYYGATNNDRNHVFIKHEAAGTQIAVQIACWMIR
jgi:hypothetical protein